MIQCDRTKRILVIGDVYIDRHLDRSLVRLGGLFHVIRGLNALESDVAAAYVCPSYLDRECAAILGDLGIRCTAKIGDVFGAPNVIEIRESGEAGTQGYDDLLRNQREIAWRESDLAKLVADYQPTDLLVLSGSLTPELLKTIWRPGIRVHLDADHDYDGVWQGVALHTVFCSTSGEPFRLASGDPETLRQSWTQAGAQVVLVKENRGGSRVWPSTDSSESFDAPSFPISTDHSVGVGDVFDATWISILESEPPQYRLRAAACIASIYASTFVHSDFVRDARLAMQNIDDVSSLHGVRLPWENRQRINIYLAAPDFPSVDVQLLDVLEKAILYHNFRARRPVRENGLVNSSMTLLERRALFSKDMELLEACDALIALPLTDDPGTYAELGWFAGSGKPTLLFDPAMQVGNLFATNIVSRVCHSRTEIIDALFELLGQSTVAE